MLEAVGVEGKMRVYGLKNCDSCRAAMKALNGKAELVDVRMSGVPEEVLAAGLEQFGAALVNRRSTTWRGLSGAERAGDALALLTAHPSLMKRPLIEDQGRLHLGWGPDVRSALGVS